MKLFGGKAVSAIVDKYKQLDDLEVFMPLDGNELTGNQRKNTLNDIDLIKEKRCSKIKIGLLLIVRNSGIF